MASSEWQRQKRRFARSPFSVYYHDEYRWVPHATESSVSDDPRGPERLARYLVYEGFVGENQLRAARRVPFDELLRIHPLRHVESLIPPGPLPAREAKRRHALQAAESIFRTLRITAGATLDAARAALVEAHPMVNLSGGFVGTPADGGLRLPSINDVAVAIAALQASGVVQRAVVVACAPSDLRGLEDCLARAGISAPAVALSTRSPCSGSPCSEARPQQSTRSAQWGRALDELPADVDLAFIVGTVGEAPVGSHSEFDAWLSVSRDRDALLVERFRHVRSVWLPGGRYGRGAWRAFAATLHALAGEGGVRVPADHPSWRLRFRAVADSISAEVLSGTSSPSWGDVALDLGLSRFADGRFLGYYTADGIEFVLQRYGVLSQLQRLGYQEFTVDIGSEAQGDRVRLLGRAGGVDHRLVECVAEIGTVAGRSVLEIHWLTLRDPLAEVKPSDEGLPGQEVPGLGIAEELAQMFAEAARRLALDGVAIVPAWYHTAYIARRLMRFLDDKRQLRFEALLKVLEGFPLAKASRLVHSGRVWLGGEPYEWEADTMVGWLDGAWRPADATRILGYTPEFSVHSEAPPRR